MKAVYSVVLFLVLLMTVEIVQATESSQKEWSDVISSEQGQFSVSVHPQQKKVEVRKVGGSQTTPPHLRVRLLRENDRPLELRLHTVEKINSPLYYTGQFKQWNDSYVGIEVDFSFDKKTWKRLGKLIRKVVP